MEELKRCNERFKELIEKAKRKHKIDRYTERLCYLFFLEGYSNGSGMTQMIL